MLSFPNARTARSFVIRGKEKSAHEFAERPSLRGASHFSPI
jgi:hypothetical protein